MNLQNKNETVSLNAKDKIPRCLNSYDLSRTDNIANKASNVNNTDAKFSRDVNMDSRRNFSNALSKAEFRQFYSILDNKENGKIINNSAVIINESKIDKTKLF